MPDGFRPRVEIRCPDCETNEANVDTPDGEAGVRQHLDALGKPNRNEDGMRFNSGCQTCGGRGKISVGHQRDPYWTGIW